MHMLRPFYDTSYIFLWTQKKNLNLFNLLMLQECPIRKHPYLELLISMTLIRIKLFFHCYKFLLLQNNKFNKQNELKQKQFMQMRMAWGKAYKVA